MKRCERKNTPERTEDNMAKSDELAAKPTMCLEELEERILDGNASLADMRMLYDKYITTSKLSRGLHPLWPTKRWGVQVQKYSLRD